MLMSAAAAAAKSLQSCLTLCNAMDCSLPGSSVHGDFPGKKYWNGLPCPPPGDLPNLETEPESLLSPALAGTFLPLGKLPSVVPVHLFYR